MINIEYKYSHRGIRVKNYTNVFVEEIDIDIIQIIYVKQSFNEFKHV